MKTLLNSLETYFDTGCKAGLAQRRRDTRLAKFHCDWLERALRLEDESFRAECRAQFNAGYKSETVIS